MSTIDAADPELVRRGLRYLLILAIAALALGFGLVGYAILESSAKLVSAMSGALFIVLGAYLSKRYTEVRRL